jgi:hypothetical protein
MNNRQRTISIALATLVLLGGMIEIMKSSRSATSTQAVRNSGIFGMSFDDENSPELSARPAREAADRARSRLSGRFNGTLGGPLGGNTNRSGGGSIDANSADGTAPAATAASVADAANLGDPKKINTADAAKKKAEADKKKKKKKKKKKSDIAKGPSVEVSVTERDETDDDSDVEPLGGGAVNVRAAIAAQATAAAKEAEEQNGEMNSLEEWIAFIMPQPNYERTMKMLQELQAKRLEPGIFHDVVTEMLADPRPKMQELAVVALGSYPSLRSYLMLQAANLRFSESSSLKVQSRNFLKAYSRVENLRYLSSVLTARVESEVMFEALRLIHSSANFYSGQTNTSSGTGSGTSPQPAATPTSVVRQFHPLVPVLNRLAQTSTDDAIRQEASTTLRQVQVITGS